MEFFSEYALFLAKTFTLLVALLALLVVVAALRSKGRGQGGELQVHKLNEFYQDLINETTDMMCTATGNC